MNEALKALDQVRLNFSPEGIQILNITIGFIMFGVALGLKYQNFVHVITNPKPVIVGILTQFFLIPGITFLLILLLKPSPSVALGMVLVAACPTGNLSNFFSFLSKSNVELAVTMIGIGDFSAIIMTPFIFGFWATLYGTISDPFAQINIEPFIMIKIMLQTIVFWLGIPTVAGMIIASKLPKLTSKIDKPIKFLSIIFLFIYIGVALSQNFTYFLKYINVIFIIVLAHNALAFITGFSISKLFGLEPRDLRTITMGSGIRNSGLGLTLIFNPLLFNGLGGMAIVAAWWGIWHIVTGMILSFFWSYRPYKKRDILSQTI